MAEFLEITKVRNYELSDGTTVDLVALIDTMSATNRWRTPVIEELAVGQVAYVAAMGEMRRGVITKITKTKVHVTFTTQGAIDHQDRYRANAGIRVQTTVTVAESIRVAPLAAPEIPADQCGCDRNPLGHTREEHPSKMDDLVAEDPRQWATENTEYPYTFTAPFTGDDVDQEMETPDETAEREAAEDERDAELDNSEDAFGDAEREEAELTTVAEAKTAILDGRIAKVTPDETAELEQMLATEPAPAAPLDPITGSAIVAVLEETWQAIRANHPELPHVVIVTGSGFIGSPRWAHWRESGWTENQHEGAHTSHDEMFVAGEALARGARHVVESMLHEGAHALATVRQVQDTSRQGRWHNGLFRKLAKEMGLEYRGQEADKVHGFSNVLLTSDTETEYAELIKKLDAAIRAVINVPAYVPGAEDGQAGGEYVHGGKRPKAEGSGSSSNYLKLTCACVDEETGEPKPRIIRASKKEAERGQMMCGVCRDYFEDRS